MNKPAVLFVEDDPGETLLTSLAFAENPLRFRAMYVYDEHEAMNYIKGEERFVNRELYPFPECVVIDLQLPHLAGLALLYWIRKQAWLSALPVILLSTHARSKSVPNRANTHVIPARDIEALFNHLETIASLSSRTIRPPSLFSCAHN